MDKYIFQESTGQISIFYTFLLLDTRTLILLEIEQIEKKKLNGLFTVMVRTRFLCPQEILPMAQENKYLRIF